MDKPSVSAARVENLSEDIAQLARELRTIADGITSAIKPSTVLHVGCGTGASEDIFSEYEQPTFEAEFGQVFSIEHREPIRDTERTLYLMELRA